MYVIGFGRRLVARSSARCAARVYVEASRCRRCDLLCRDRRHSGRSIGVDSLLRRRAGRRGSVGDRADLGRRHVVSRRAHRRHPRRVCVCATPRAAARRTCSIFVAPLHWSGHSRRAASATSSMASYGGNRRASHGDSPSILRSCIQPRPPKLNACVSASPSSRASCTCTHRSCTKGCSRGWRSSSSCGGSHRNRGRALRRPGCSWCPTASSVSWSSSCASRMRIAAICCSTGSRWARFFPLPMIVVGLVLLVLAYRRNEATGNLARAAQPH